MSIKDCLDNLVRAGQIQGDEADALRKVYESLLKHYGSADAAKAELVDRLIKTSQTQKRQALVNEETRTKLEGFMLSFRNARGEPDPARALTYILEHNGQVRMPEGMSSVAGRSKSILAIAQAKMEEGLFEFRRTWITGATRNTARLESVLRSLLGEKTGDPAADLIAKTFSEVAEYMRQRFNAAGGAIGKLEKWGISQSHNRLAMMKAGKDQWVSFTRELLDPSRMRHPMTGKPMLQHEVDESLGWIYDDRSTNGWHERQPTERTGMGALGNSRSEHRFLVFKDADSWLKYSREFGSGGNVFADMMGHIKGMAEDIGALEILGVNPRENLSYLQRFVERQAALKAARMPAVFPDKTEYMGTPYQVEGTNSWFGSKNPEDYARSQIRLSNHMWEMYNGSEAGVVSQKIADTFATARNLNVAAKLGSAAVSAVTDVGFQQMARYFTGLPMLKAYGDYMKSFAGGNRREAVRAGLMLDTAVHVLHEQARWAGSMHGPAWTRVLADRVIASTGLQAMTQASRHGFGIGIMAELASHTASTLDQLPPGMQKAFQRYGLTAKDWDAMRLDANGAPRDVDILSGKDVFDSMVAAGRGKENVAERYLEMILQETEYATPSGTLQAQARAYGGLQRGVLRDELFRSMGQFKMFGMSVALLQGQRIASDMIESGVWRGAGYAGGLLILTTLYGALAMQLKEIIKGNDPREMTGDKAVKFWGAALMQGGGMGIYGDFLASETSRTGGGLARTLLGPTADVAAGLLAIGPGNIAQLMKGEKTNTGRELVKFAKSNTPFGSNWYLRLAYERIVLDQLQKQVDPEAYKQFRSQVGRRRKELGSEMFWSPGDRFPSRGPRLTR
jgi:hypothetical protein